MNIKIKQLNFHAKVPTYGTPGAAAFDLYAVEGVLIRPGESDTVRTGLAIEVPVGHCLLVFSRSGHGFKHNLRLANCVGVIDSDYRGELLVKLTNDNDPHHPDSDLADKAFHVVPGDRIAQALVLPIPRCTFEWTAELSETGRGAGGMGSSGR